MFGPHDEASMSTRHDPLIYGPRLALSCLTRLRVGHVIPFPRYARGWHALCCAILQSWIKPLFWTSTNACALQRKKYQFLWTMVGRVEELCHRTVDRWWQTKDASFEDHDMELRTWVMIWSKLMWLTTFFMKSFQFIHQTSWRIKNTKSNLHRCHAWKIKLMQI